MLKVTAITKIYILSPYIKTGGPKSLHQLAFFLKKNGLNTYITYYIHYKKSKRNILFSNYNMDITNEIQDNPENILIVPEAYTGELRKYKNIQKVIWWLSLDYYFIDLLLKKSALYTIKRKNLPKLFIPIVLILKYLRLLYKPHALNIKDFRHVFHFYNCEYVHQFLQKNNVSEENTKYLCGPIEDLYFSIGKENILANKTRTVAFNPAKIEPKLLGRLKKAIHDKDITIELIELKNMTKKEVFNTLCRTKVYVDLGFFPGPERIPREAVTLYCNVITSTEGSAANQVDVMIPDKYKFDIKNLNIENLINLIFDMVNNFERYIDDFDNYRLKVVKQKDIFRNNLQTIFLNKGEM